MASEAVEVVIMGRSYKVACPKGQDDALHQSVTLLEETLQDFKKRATNANNEQLAVLVALNLCHELQLEKEKNRSYSETVGERIKSLQSTIEVALMPHHSDTSRE